MPRRSTWPGPRSVAIATSVVAIAHVGVRTGAADRLDRSARDALARPLGDRADLAIGAVTDLGSVYGLAGIAGSLAATDRRRAAGDVLVAGGAAWVLAQGLKSTLHRPRPYQLDAAARLVAVPAGSSWPSGHAAVAAATATTLAPRVGPAVRVVGVGYVAAVGVSRLYVGVHHLTDIVAGVAVGMLSAAAGERAARWACVGRLSRPRGAATGRRRSPSGLRSGSRFR